MREMIIPSRPEEKPSQKILRQAHPVDVKEAKKRRRERIAIVVILVLFVALTFAEFRLTKLSNSLPFVNSIFFFGLLNLNLVLLATLVWLISRNVGKLFFEAKGKLVGARLKTKLVIAFLAFSIIPTLALFSISSSYINSSFDKWFSIKVQNTLEASLEISRIYYRDTDQRTLHFADHLAQQLSQSFKSGRLKYNSASLIPSIPPWIKTYLKSQRQLLALDSIEFYSDPLDMRFLVESPEKTKKGIQIPHLTLDLLNDAFSGNPFSIVQNVGTGDLIRSLVPITHDDSNRIAGVLVVNQYIPVSLVNKVDTISRVFEDYKDINPLKYPIKTTYFIFLILITLVIIFFAIWIGLYIAGELTIPVERLVEGVQEVGSGNLDVVIESKGEDELAVLIDSFNKMILDLKENRKRLTHTSSDLEKRKLQLEAVLANIGTGVLVVDNSGGIMTFNRAASKLLGVKPNEVIGRQYKEILTGETVPLIEIIERCFSTDPESSFSPAEITQWNYRQDENVKSLAGIATPLRDNLVTWGVVVVIDDMTHIIKGQREMAWREVARRIAHEIKNPLTPIKLSAQRLQRRLSHLRGREGILLEECTSTIVKHTDELKEMVNEFSNFARLPETSLSPQKLNDVVREVVSLLSQAHPHIFFYVNTEEHLPIFEFDRDQIKRVIFNILDNSVSALLQKNSGNRSKISVETHFNTQLRMAVIAIKDNGPGMDEDTKSRVFEPYFSTKKEGTGLGLAIAKRIINDHHGFIRVNSQLGSGTEFLIELPTTLKQSLSPME